MHFSRFAKFAAVLASLALGIQAHAAPVRFGTYYDETAPIVTCSGPVHCEVFFSQLPSDKLLLVRKVTCQITSQSRVVQAFLYVAGGNNGSGTIARHTQLAVPSDPIASGIFYISIDAEPRWLIGQGRFPYVSVSAVAGGSIVMDCTLVGDLVDTNP